MLELDHFSSGLANPVLAYVMSVIGSALGLRSAVHARASRRPGGWLFAAAVALGGCGIWVMHFIAMLGFSIEGTRIRYDMPTTLLSAAIAIAVVWIGLSIVVRVRREAVGLPIGGAITGLGVAAMHYLGMHAMHSGAHIEYRPPLVALSIVIAVVAATAALWFMLHVQGFFASIGTALVMGVAVCGMHYTGMAAMRAHSMNHLMPESGSDPIQLLTPLILAVTVVTMTLIVVVGLAEIESSTQRELPEIDLDLVDSGRNWPRLDPNADIPRPEPTASLRTFARATPKPSSGRQPAQP
ncbi:MAG: putative rane protein [Nocardia sp.]|uniref:MHYT domain-containing protein n=1 Tax=Nocardia sp. TaxID=1821 RepID=UPI0026358D4E|nr:MHYT domain-containing protein [Nocardia sp.]MCU1640559.1 putative rane protein [Nocardia sp.]